MGEGAIAVSLPQPYWQDESRGVTLWRDDCLRVLPTVPDRSVDMVFCVDKVPKTV